MTGNEQKANSRKDIYASRMKAAASRTCSGKSAEADVLIVSVRHIPFRDADEILNHWNPKMQGYVFHIFSENLYVQDYLRQKYLPEEKGE